MSELLGKAVLELDADAGPLDTALAAMEGTALGRVRSLGTNMKSIMGGNWKQIAAVMAVGIGTGVVAAGAALYKLGSSFDEAYDNITAKTGATGAELDKLKGTFKDVFASVPTDMKSASDAVAGLNQRLGLTGEPLAALSKQMIQLSNLTGEDLSTNIASVSKAFTDWEVPVDQMSGTLDGFYALSQETGISVGDLASSVQRFGSPLRQLGFSLSEAAAMFAVFEKAGVNTGTATSGMKIALANLIDPTDELNNKMKQLGITADTPKEKLAQVFQMFTDKGIPAADKTGLAMELFGKRAGADMAEAIKQGRFSLEDMTKVMDGGKGSINKAAEATYDLSEQWTMFKNGVLVKLEPIAARVFNGINNVLIFTMQNGKTVAAVLGGVLAVLAASYVAAGVAAVKSAALQVWAWLTTRAKAIASLAGQLIAFAMLTAQWIAAGARAVASAVLIAAQWVMMGAAAMANALVMAAAWVIATGGLILIVAAVIAAVALIIANWDRVKAFLVKFWPYILAVMLGPLGLIIALVVKNFGAIKQFITTTLTAVLSFIVSIWTTITGAIGVALSAVGSAIGSAWNAIKSITSRTWNTVKTLVTSGINAVVRLVRTLPGKVSSALASLGSTLMNIMRAAWNRAEQAVRDGVNSTVSIVRGIGGKIKGALDDAGSWLVSAGADIVQGLINGITSKMNALIQKVKEMANKVKEGAKGILGIFSPSRVFYGYGQNVSEGFALGISDQMKRLDASVTGAFTLAPPPPVSTAGATGSNMPDVARLANAIEELNRTGGSGVIDALVSVVNERIGYGAVGTRRVTAGTGRLIP